MGFHEKNRVLYSIRVDIGNRQMQLIPYLQILSQPSKVVPNDLQANVVNDRPLTLVILCGKGLRYRVYNYFFLRKDTGSFISIQQSLIVFFPKKTGSCIPLGSSIVLTILVHGVLYSI